MLFIIIHQVYELWFKELLHEFDRVMRLLEGDESHRAQHTLKRILTILKVMVAQLDILETMTPLEFLSFRERLEAASGFQSDQFRQIEFVLGVKSEQRDRALRRRQPRARRAGAPLRGADAVGRVPALSRRAKATPCPPAHLARDVDRAGRTVGRHPATLVDVYRRDPKNAELCERLVDLDEGIQEWRYRHVKMVERTIGTKRGTGGSAARRICARRSAGRSFPTCGPSARSCRSAATLLLSPGDVRPSRCARASYRSVSQRARQDRCGRCSVWLRNCRTLFRF